MVKVLGSEYERGRSTAAHVVNHEDFKDYCLFSSEPFTDDFPMPVVAYCRGELPVDYFECLHLKIVSEKCRAILENLAVSMQFLPIKLTNMNGRVYGGGQYFFAHLLAELDCFDYEKSSFETRKFGSGKKVVRDVQSLVLRDELVGTEPVFTLKDISFFPCLASDEFVQAIEETDLVGFLFEDVTDYAKQHARVRT